MRGDESLDEALERLLAEAACRRLVLQAAQAVDHHQPAVFAALFAPDGVLVRPNGQPLEGCAAIEAAYAGRPPGRITRHLVTSTLVSFTSPTEARGLSPVLLWHRRPAGSRRAPRAACPAAAARRRVRRPVRAPARGLAHRPA